MTTNTHAADQLASIRAQIKALQEAESALKTQISREIGDGSSLVGDEWIAEQSLTARKGGLDEKKLVAAGVDVDAAVAQVEEEYGYDDEQEDGGGGDYDRGHATEGDHRELLQPGELAAGYEGAGGDWQAEGGGEEEGGADDQGDGVRVFRGRARRQGRGRGGRWGGKCECAFFAAFPTAIDDRADRCCH